MRIRSNDCGPKIATCQARFMLVGLKILIKLNYVRMNVKTVLFKGRKKFIAPFANVHNLKYVTVKEIDYKTE